MYVGSGHFRGSNFEFQYGVRKMNNFFFGGGGGVGMGYDETMDIFSGPSQKWIILRVITKHSRAFFS